jgi:hypothetical protein
VFLDRCSGESAKIPGFDRWSHFSEAGDRVRLSETSLGAFRWVGDEHTGDVWSGL